uniref:NADH dehydrogenase subunit 4 n=1 Tax=Haltichella nipponensis TaxID=2907788 RepID=UPI001EDE0E31|nr:NADH dehydrogenase subunit 4 [Haltichella nipponensis]UIB40568.1 NADH dehydrogenase subunit 4 [Haltichella nipponensis]
MMKLLMYNVMLLFMMNYFKKQFLMIFYSNLIILNLLILIINYNFMNMFSMIYSSFGLDNLSFLMIFMLIIIISIMYLSNDLNYEIYMLSFLLLMMFISLLLMFSTMNYFVFYIFFEISMIPTFMLIMGWGYQYERINASMYMFFYTMLFSMPMLLFIYYLFQENNSLMFMLLFNKMLNMNIKFYFMYFYLMMAFFVKLPMFMFHLWLPKAHVEAPMIGSMFLASVMLKLGGYGILRTQMFMLNYSVKMNYVFMSISIIGIFIISLICLVQVDMKMIVAYSSIVHMGIMMLGLMSMYKLGLLGGMFIMLGHGFCSSALFMMINYFYQRSKSRMIYFNKGMLMLSPSLMIMWFMFCMGNISMPTSMNLLGEMIMFMIFIKWNINFFIFFGLSVFLSTIYSIKLFSVVYHNKNYLNKFYIMKFKEFYLMFIHLIYLYMMFMLMNIMF